MTLNELAKSVQEYVKEGIVTLLVYKTGRSWEYKAIWETDNEEMENAKIIETVKNIDENYVDMNTYECFTATNLKCISFQIKRTYEKNKYGSDERNVDVLEEINDFANNYESCYNETTIEQKEILQKYFKDTGLKKIAEVSEEIDSYINEDVEVKIHLNAKTAEFLSKFALEHNEGNENNMATRKPLFIVKSLKSEEVEAGLGDRIAYRWRNNLYDDIADIAKNVYGTEVFEKMEEVSDYRDIAYEEGKTIIMRRNFESFIKSFKLENEDIQQIGIIEYYVPVAYFFIKSEARDYINKQKHNLRAPQIYGTSSGYSNNSEYEYFYDLLMEIGEKLNREE